MHLLRPNLTSGELPQRGAANRTLRSQGEAPGRFKALKEDTAILMAAFDGGSHIVDGHIGETAV